MSSLHRGSTETAPVESPQCQPESDTRLGKLSTLRKVTLLVFLCIAQFTDTFANSALFAAIPPISAQLGISNSNSVWLISGYQLTFAALLLVSGRLSDLYNPKWVFVSGAFSIGVLALGSGFVRAEVPLIILRALCGVGAALTVPSALYIIIHMFSNPISQSKAIAAFAGSAALGNVIGLTVGALLVTFTSWPWVFYFIAILGLLLAAVVLVLCPSPDRAPTTAAEKARQFKRLDLLGVSALTIGLVLFIYAVTAGSANGWNHAGVIVPLILSVGLVIFFFFWESYVSEDMAAVPPKMWSYSNFTILIATTLVPFMWWGVVQSLFSWLWQDVYGWSAIITALHFLPLGLLGFPVTALANLLQHMFSPKWVIMFGNVLALAGSLLLVFADSPEHYWRFAFPGFCLGTSGITIIFATLNIAVFSVTLPKDAGVVGAIFNCSLQLGCAAGIAIITSVQTSIDKSHGGTTSFAGRAAGLWFMFGILCAETIGILVFMKNTVNPLEGEMQDNEKSRSTP